MNISRQNQPHTQEESAVTLCNKFNKTGNLCSNLRDTCLGQYVPSLGFFHNDQTCVDVIILRVLQLHSAVINCRQVREKTIWASGVSCQTHAPCKAFGLCAYTGWRLCICFCCGSPGIWRLWRSTRGTGSWFPVNKKGSMRTFRSETTAREQMIWPDHELTTGKASSGQQGYPGLLLPNTRVCKHGDAQRLMCLRSRGRYKWNIKTNEGQCEMWKYFKRFRCHTMANKWSISLRLSNLPRRIGSFDP